MQLAKIRTNSGVTWAQSSEPILAERFVGGSWLDTTTPAAELLKTWDGSNWVVQDYVTGVYPGFPPVITSSSTASGTQGGNFSYQITATNSPTSFNATGLPSGITINTATGLISGSYASTGSFSVTLYASNSAGTGIINLNLTINVPAYGPNVFLGASALGSDDWSGFYASSMFDGAVWPVWTTYAASTHWVRCQLGTAKIVQKVTLSSGTTPGNYAAKDFQIQGSNDGGSWTPLLYIYGATWGSQETKAYTFSNSNAYSFYRLYITAMAVSPSYAEMSEMTGHEVV